MVYTGRKFSGVRRPASPSMAYFQSRVRADLTGGVGQAAVNGAGVAVVTVGPQGAGTIWYPTMAVVSTTTGADDTSTVRLYLGAVNVNSQLGGQSYAGGGSTVGLSTPPVHPGEYLIAVWSGAQPGDQATLVVYGNQTALA